MCLQIEFPMILFSDHFVEVQLVRQMSLEFIFKHLWGFPSKTQFGLPPPPPLPCISKLHQLPLEY